jgi:hypothetical protein
MCPAHLLDSRFGIFDRTWRHYDAKHLVWNHPLISPQRMHYLLREVIKALNRPLDIYVEQFSRLVRERLSATCFDFIWRDFIRSPVISCFADRRKHIVFENLPQKTPVPEESLEFLLRGESHPRHLIPHPDLPMPY